MKLDFIQISLTQGFYCHPVLLSKAGLYCKCIFVRILAYLREDSTLVVIRLILKPQTQLLLHYSKQTKMLNAIIIKIQSNTNDLRFMLNVASAGSPFAVCINLIHLIKSSKHSRFVSSSRSRTQIQGKNKAGQSANTKHKKRQRSPVKARGLIYPLLSALIPVLQTTDMREAFNFPLKCPGTTEGWGGAVCLLCVDSLIRLVWLR